MLYLFVYVLVSSLKDAIFGGHYCKCKMEGSDDAGGSIFMFSYTLNLSSDNSLTVAIE